MFFFVNKLAQNRGYRIRLFIALVVLLAGCAEQEVNHTLFESVPPTHTGIEFINEVEGDAELNIFNYRNFYNGGGVAIGDINNDGLADVFLVSNMRKNRLYLNKGDFKFEDITEKAGVGGDKAWSTGVTFADVNGDGFLDIYVCNAGNRKDDDRSNEFFINNGDLTFTEKAKEYGLADKGFSTHAAFFDYDRDGDLDVYLLNNSFIPVGKLAYKNLRSERDSLGGHKLFRNDGETFKNVSEEAGIYGSLISFGLGITVGDFNDDNWLDIYISNDFYERDYLYINNRDGSFKEDIKQQMRHVSLSSMGADVADLNNDGFLDIFVTDMLPADNRRLKTLSTFEGYDLFQLKRSRDYHNQIMQNTLQLNNNDDTFSEIARFAGVEATDWSWGALLFDMDNDGSKDIFVANGMYKDVTEQDFVNFLVDEKTIAQMANGKKFNFKEFQDKMASTPIANYAFKNVGNVQFVNNAKPWGLDNPSFSNGASYGDLDNDGDLDLVINNVNQPVSIFRNSATDIPDSHFLRVKLAGSGRNLHAIGAKVYIYQQGSMQYLQEMPNRGFQSSVDHVLIFGLSKRSAIIDSLKVIWPDDKTQTLYDIAVDNELVLRHEDANNVWTYLHPIRKTPFVDLTQMTKLDFVHKENAFADYYQTPLLKQMYSTQGPAIATGDVNGDGLEDVLFGCAKGFGMKLFLQRADGTFSWHHQEVFATDTLSEITDAIFFDADNDSDLDLFLVTGGNEFGYNDPALKDKLFRNDGQGNFSAWDRLPNIFASGSCVAAADFDQDGDIDLFVGGRLIPGKYGYDPPSHLYVNDGSGDFKNYTRRYFPSQEMGMVTSATWSDIDDDSYPELILVGDWMPITIFKNEKGRSFSELKVAGLDNSSGWWNCIKASDIDVDGDVDFIVGNLGSNSRIRAGKSKPAELFIKDFDNNGAVEQIITLFSEDGQSFPMVLKHELEKQLPFIKKRFIKHSDFAGKTIAEIFTEEELNGVLTKKVYNTHTSLLINEGNGKFLLKPLPAEAQYTAIFGIEVLDYDLDGLPDLLLCGNFHDVLPEIGAYDASYGLILKGKGNLDFEPIAPRESGFFVNGQVRKLRIIAGRDKDPRIIAAKNNDSVQVFGIDSRFQSENKIAGNTGN